MKRAITPLLACCLALGLASRSLWAGPMGLANLSEKTKACIECHRSEDPSIYQQWGDSRHYRAAIGCYECHAAGEDDPDAFEHGDYWIATIVSPKDCARCHQTEAEEFANSRHSRAGQIIGSLDNVLAEVVEGNTAMKTEGFPEGVSAAAVTGCWQCHGSVVKVLGEGELDPATWPNTGIGRINPDGSNGSCSACHSRHRFSVEQVRHPDNCGRCHMGPDHPQKEIYYESKHGISFVANKDRLNLASPKWIVGEDYSAAPTCATCHMSATRDRAVTHDVGLRISWNNRPAVSIRPEVSDKQMGLPGAEVGWETRRENMVNVCVNCHSRQWVESFYVQYDALIELYNEKFAKPGLELYNLATPLLQPVKFANKLDFTWYEIWHHAGRRARHGASMMGPDYTHWHGMYEVAKRFYTEFVPELRALVREGKSAQDPQKAAAAQALDARLEEVLNSENHRWYLDKMAPEEKERRNKAAEEFRKRYGRLRHQAR